MNVNQPTVNASYEAAETCMDANNPEVRHYYSTYWGNVIMLNLDEKGDETTNPSKITRIVSVHFSNPGNPSHTKQAAKNGHFATADPAIIKALDKRRAKQVAAGQKPDIMTPEEFQLAIMSPEDAIAKMQAEVAALKAEKLVVENRLASAVNNGQGVAQAGRR